MMGAGEIAALAAIAFLGALIFGITGFALKWGRTPFSQTCGKSGL